MFYIDVLSAYLICGVSALIGALVLRLAETDDLSLRPAVHKCSQALVTLGVGLLPAGLGEGAAHPAAQFSLTFGSLAGVVLMAQGMAQLQGRRPSVPWLWSLLGALAAGMGATLLAGPLVLGKAYALALAGTGTLLAWQGRGFIRRPRATVERGLGLVLLLVSVSGWLRAGFTLAYAGPPRANLTYVPALAEPLLASLYGVIPMVLATLLLSLVNSRLHQQLRSRAATDELTNTMTRRALREQAPLLITMEHQRQHEVAVVMFDLDHFKAVNDRHGHAAGDGVLRAVAATLRTQLRHDALLARYGGEEFVAVVPVADLSDAAQMAERLRQAVEEISWARAAGLAHGVTVSLGLTLAERGEHLDAMLQRADTALYGAKRDGRNRVRLMPAQG